MTNIDIYNRVVYIINDVLNNGDSALEKYSLKFEGLDLKPKSFKI